MKVKEEEFLRKLRSAFKTEAEERLNAVSSGLLELEKSPETDERKRIVEAIFREAHSLKGAARTVNLIEIESICQSIENVFAALKRDEIGLFPKLFDTLYLAVDTIEEVLSASEKKSPFPDKARIAELTHQIELLGVEGTASPLQVSSMTVESQESGVLTVLQTFADVPSGEAEQEEGPFPDSGPQLPLLNPADLSPGSPSSIKVSTGKLDSLFHRAEEMLSLKLVGSRHVADLRDALERVEQWGKEWNRIIPEVHSARRFLEKKARCDLSPQVHGKVSRLIEFFDSNDIRIQSLAHELRTLLRVVEQDHRSLGGMVEYLLEEMKKVLMLPFGSILEGFPRLVRDLARSQGKEVECVFRGSEIEMDRRILEEMKDPLVHLLRNSVDHGIEEPHERVRNGKPPRGKITVAVSRIHGNKAEVLVTDDGRGMEVEKIREEALRRGIVSRGEADTLNEHETLSLIFLSGLSSSPVITHISGRGLGLAIVRERVEKLNGHISLETRPSAGSSFRIVLPVTLATFRGVLVQAAGHTFVIPTVNVERAVRIRKNTIRTMENKETVLFNEHAVSLIRLSDVLELTRKEGETGDPEYLQALVLGAVEKRIAFVVDAILGEREVLVKDLGKQLVRVRNIAGATVLGSGRIVPILNVFDLMKSAVKATPASVRSVSGTGGQTEKEKGAVLVVEDSFTSRILLKNILESAGYRVQTAVDGVDGLTALKTKPFDAVVSDVEMPRMNGFDLTMKIRSDRKLSELPVILVTGLESREDRERGIDVGANAYIVKSNFEQSDLLEVLQRLVGNDE